MNVGESGTREDWVGKGWPGGGIREEDWGGRVCNVVGGVSKINKPKRPYKRRYQYKWINKNGH